MSVEEKAMTIVSCMFVESNSLHMTWQMAKNCAVISVNEIIKIIKKHTDDYLLLEYWRQVLKEIEKL